MNDDDAKENPNEDDSGGDSVKRHIQQFSKEEDASDFTFSSHFKADKEAISDFSFGKEKRSGNSSKLLLIFI